RWRGALATSWSDTHSAIGNGQGRLGPVARLLVGQKEGDGEELQDRNAAALGDGGHSDVVVPQAARFRWRRGAAVPDLHAAVRCWSAALLPSARRCGRVCCGSLARQNRGLSL